MALNKKEFSNYIRKFSFRELFNDMGWNNDKTTQPIVVDNNTFTLQAVAEKSGFKILLCGSCSDGTIPDYTTRKKIETKVTKLFQEHLIIFFDDKKQEQIWQLVVRQTGKPTKVTETRWHVTQDPELLFQRASGIFFEIDEEENITIVDVTRRMAANFHQNNEKVTKQFYDKFKKEHTSFLQFIKGIDDRLDKDWYASLMLNRLMFCYFIQKKGFLDNNTNYLRDKLQACTEKKGKNQFYSFYRNFLLLLFHQGLGAPEHTPELKVEIGKIPYLNGGLFDEHELETTYTGIDIDDKAFERIFDFFDQYEWHLDTRITASGKDINPDVIGYIFEKYINDRAQMGAYYTKEDITDYISKNCILPYLFDETKRQYPKAFATGSELWQMVKESNGDYIYDAVKYGIEQQLPPEVTGGISSVANRTEWNKSAPLTHALPTEIWREVIDRHNRCNEVKSKIEKGEITNINDFITQNLNIRQFAQDAIENTTDAEFLKQFYKSLNSVTIIDPTCGSGAFLFAAMNILEPLYECCIQRMENFVAEAPKGKFKYFEDTLTHIKAPEHPNLQYYIYKSIILNNLYGVDIMKEATEIAKLRLFLKLVATVEADYRKPNLGLEPLPDVDFNIRSGNSLIGFANANELTNALISNIHGAEVRAKIEEKCEIVSKAFARYKEIQLSNGDDFKQFKHAKDELNKRLKELNNELNKLLHSQISAMEYEKWLQTHQPFHWLAEFYEIIDKTTGRGGFDIIIGNPPYVELKDVKSYTLRNYKTLKCGNLYAICYERALQLVNNNGFIGFIIPVASVCTDGYSDLQRLWINNGNLFISCFNDRPGKLFEGLEHIRLAIVLLKKGDKETQIFTTKYNKWNTIARDQLFDNLAYQNVTSAKDETLIPKLSHKLSHSILEKLQKNRKKTSSFIIKSSSNKIFFTRKLSGFVQILDFIPKIYDNNNVLRNPSELKELKFDTNEQAQVYLSVLNSSLFYWFLTVWSDCRNLNQRELQNFNFDFSLAKNDTIALLSDLSNRLMADINEKSVMQSMSFKNVGKLEIQCIYPKYSKPIIDEIDTVLAKHYGFTDEELDFIINYDIKYRLGRDLEGEDEE